MRGDLQRKNRFGGVNRRKSNSFISSLATESEHFWTANGHLQKKMWEEPRE